MRKPELSALTGVRFYAALLVFASHITVLPGMHALAGDQLIFNAGVVGVAFFFVLSGFILTYNYTDVFKDGLSGRDYRRFVWDRWTKIYPVHFLAMLMVLPIAVLSPHDPLDWRVVPFHLFLGQCWWPLSEPKFYYNLNVPSWSISCEWFFYLLAPVLIFWVLGGSRRWLPLILALAYAVGLGVLLARSDTAQRLYSVSWFAPSRVVEFLAGIFLARAFLNPAGKVHRLSPALLQGAGLFLIVAGAIYRRSAPWPLWGGLLYVPGASLLVLGLAEGRSGLARHLAHPWVKVLGTASFSFYLLHSPILRATRAVCNLLKWEVQSWPGFFLVAVLMFAVVQACALLVCYRFEMPVQQWLRRRRPLERPPEMACSSA